MLTELPSFWPRRCASCPRIPRLVWHDHFGRDLAGRRAWQYRPIVKRVKAIVAVSRPLAQWSKERLRIPPERVSYIPNFVTVATADGPVPTLPGMPGARLVCVANWREQKDHLTLLHAFEFVLQRMPTAHLLLVGAENDGPYGDQIRREIARQALNGSVSVLGSRRDVPAILAECDVGVLSSVSEGLPLALLEYGLAGLPGVATAVGQCPEVLDYGRRRRARAARLSQCVGSRAARTPGVPPPAEGSWRSPPPAGSGVL